MFKGWGFETAVAVVATSVCGWLGGWDTAMKMLVGLMVIDYVLGLFGAVKQKRMDSNVMFWGGLRKGAILLVIGLAVMIDQLVGNSEPVFRTLAFYFYAARELLSIVENLGILGVPLPPFINKVLAQLQEKGDVK